MSEMKLGITGFPLSHTKSPALHRGFLKKAGLRGSYEVHPFDPERGKKAFFRFLDALAAGGLRGLNVTIPLKEWAFEYAAERGGAASGFGGRCARLVKAANTLVFAGRSVRAANTDSEGLWDDLGRWGAWLRARRSTRLVVVGTGGSARGAIAGVLARHPEARTVRSVRVWGRDARKARALERMAGKPEGRPARGETVLVVWCLPPVAAGTARKILEAALGGDAAGAKVFLYDLNYGERARPTGKLVPSARRREGAGMLAIQARASFELWLRG